jgi:dihydrofolate reductase
MRKPIVCLVAAVARDRGIGLRGRLLVHLPDDLPRFRRLTFGSPVVMGRKTWESLGRPLPGRHNIVVTRDRHWQAAGASTAHSLPEAMALAGSAERVFVIGGAEVYALALPVADELELTEIDAEFAADAFFPDWNRAEFRQTSLEDRQTPEGLHYAFASYRKIDQGD